MSNVLSLKSDDVFRKELLLEVIFLLRHLVFKQELSSDTTCWTCEFTHNRGVNCVFKKNLVLKTFLEKL